MSDTLRHEPTRQRNMMPLVSRGWSVRDIAEHLLVSNNTVKCHLSATYKKLGVNRREQLCNYLPQLLVMPEPYSSSASN